MDWEMLDFRYGSRLAETFVMYPEGALESSSQCVGIVELRPDDGKDIVGIITESTAIHPISSTWPDQPADRGRGQVRGEAFDLIGAIEATIVPNGDTMTISPGTAKRRVHAEEAFEVVVHLVEDDTPVDLGVQVDFSADRDFRRSLCVAHSACHLQAFALNQTLADFWKKTVERMDSLGHADFDQIAIESSTIHPDFSVDVYRMGRSLRKKGFIIDRLVNEAEVIRKKSENQLQSWIGSGFEIEVSGGDGRLGDRREWSCNMGSARVTIPCGGTHVANTSEIGNAQIEWELSPEHDYLTVTTKVVRG